MSVEAWKIDIATLEVENKKYTTTPSISFNEIERLFPGFKISSTYTTLSISFDSVEAAEKWCSNLAINYRDNALLVGSEDSKLVKAYGTVRVNQGLYHILWYMGK